MVPTWVFGRADGDGATEPIDVPSGQYARVDLDGDGEFDTVWVGCPMCGERMNLAGCGISREGRVSPLQECPSGACRFRSGLRLEGWS